MEELINQLKQFFGEKAQRIEKKAPAEIDIVINDGYNINQLSTELQEHIINFVNEDTLAKINLLDKNNKEVDSFSLNQ